MDLVTRLIAHWRSQGIICPGGASLDEIETFQTRNYVTFPSDMRAYLLAVNGTGGHKWDDEFFSFWSLADIRSISSDMPDRSARFAESSRYFLFADHSIFLPAFAIRLTADAKETNPVVCVVADRGLLEVRPAFDSFTEFVSTYLDDPVSASLGMRAQSGQKWKSDEMTGTPCDPPKEPDKSKPDGKHTFADRLIVWMAIVILACMWLWILGWVG